MWGLMRRWTGAATRREFRYFSGTKAPRMHTATALLGTGIAPASFVRANVCGVFMLECGAALANETREI